MKRLFDFTAAATGLLLLAPLLLSIAVLIRLESRGPALFLQERVGRGGRPFRIHKFRTMVADAPRLGASITVGRDPRITRVGSWLRRYKLDELPQLIDVLIGNMSLVGPRPEVPQFVAAYPPEVRNKVLSVRPGLTDNASLEFIDESSLLAEAADPEREYLERILPKKLRHYIEYVDGRSMTGDLWILFRTLARILWR